MRPVPLKRMSIAVAFALLVPFLAPVLADEYAEQVETVNRAFLAHLDALGGEHALAAESVRQGWDHFREQAPESFVPEALGVLYPAFGEALQAFDLEQSGLAAEGFAGLLDHADPFVVSNATYFRVRALVDLGRFEEIEAAFETIAEIDGTSPYADRLRFIRSVAKARILQFEEASDSVERIEASDAALSEPVRNGARQLRLELERREAGTLDEVATMMDYVAERLHVADETERMRRRQQEVLDLLDKLIEEEEQQEQHGGGAAGAGGSEDDESQGRELEKGRAGGRGDPSGGLDDSEAPPAGRGEIGDMHAAPRIDPGEMWGKLPPGQRERILQAIRERFPSRYRQLVEQYYRSLAEE